jgi:2-desacetyl-2-hydroxyethyl bacteriochlorophyllide A dehydrogenase
MKAMVLERFGEPLQWREVPLPQLGAGEALVRITACGLCGTDLKISAGKLAGTPLPLIMGHEPAGEVVEVGSAVSNVQVGDQVAVHFYVTCGQCEYCRTDRDSLCPNLSGRLGFELDGGFAEYVKVPAGNLFSISSSVPPEQVAVLGDCVATVWHGVRRRAQVQPGQDVVVMGTGGLGVHAIQVLRLSGARIIGVDIAPEKLELARQMGADEVVDARHEDVAARVLDLTHGAGVDAVLEFVGSPEVVQTDLSVLKRGGVLVLLGYVPGQSFQAASTDVVLTEKRMVGSRASSKQDLIDVIRLVERGLLKPVITKRFPLEQVNQAMSLLASGQILGRAVVVP